MLILIFAVAFFPILLYSEAEGGRFPWWALFGTFGTPTFLLIAGAFIHDWSEGFDGNKQVTIMTNSMRVPALCVVYKKQKITENLK